MFDVRQLSLPDNWRTITVATEFDAPSLVLQVAEAHRCLADIDGPHAATCRTIADQLEAEIDPAKA